MKVLLLAAVAITLISAAGCDRRKTGDDMNIALKTKPAAQDLHTNRLISETSPYLLQHAHNPVNWYPWGKEAFNKARSENKPIFLSIGYSACHWCHVMEKESFENDDIAAILNEHFISIKVDREERPDVDEIYMTSVVMMTGSGGWPLSVFLTPDLEPFFGGTYFPPNDMFGRPGFKNLLLRIAETWSDRHGDVLSSARRLTSALQEAHKPTPGPESIDLETLTAITTSARYQLTGSFDKTWGGFGNAPKFPQSGALSLLLRQYAKSRDGSVLSVVTTTLDRMAYGGIYDQLGGGFHRYSVDRQWLVPHFEKMLYDNALLSSTYLEAYQITRSPLYRRIAEETLDYVIRDMTDDAGGFHSTLDADSEGVEGKYYVWTREHIIELLGEQEGDVFCTYYGVTSRGNFEGENILHIPKNPDSFAKSHKIISSDLQKRLKISANKLLAERGSRIPPSKDDKVLSSWNGMMISSFAHAYQVLGHKRHLTAAENAGQFLLSTMIEDGELFRSYRHGTKKIPAYLDDYANVANAFIDLYEATFDAKWLQSSDMLTKKMIELFWDNADHGFYATSLHHQNLLTRTKPFSDSSVPSGNSIGALLLLRLSRLTGNSDYASKLEQLLAEASPRLQSSAAAHTHLLLAVDFLTSPSMEIVVAGSADSPDTRSMLEAIREKFLPNKVLVLADPAAVDAALLHELVPLAADKPTINDLATAYVCEDYSCKKPVTDISELSKLLDAR